MNGFTSISESSLSSPIFNWLFRGGGGRLAVRDEQRWISVRVLQRWVSGVRPISRVSEIYLAPDRRLTAGQRGTTSFEGASISERSSSSVLSTIHSCKRGAVMMGLTVLTLTEMKSEATLWLSTQSPPLYLVAWSRPWVFRGPCWVPSVS